MSLIANVAYVLSRRVRTRPVYDILDEVDELLQ